jgi:outer membrane protein
MQILKLLPLALLPLVTLAAPDPVPIETAASSSPWSAMLRATYLVTTDGSSPKMPIKIEDKLIPEFDIGYELSEHWAVELVLTVPQEHGVKSDGADIGDFKHLPPTLLVKYLPGDFAGFTPYVGAGVNFTLIFDEHLPNGLKLDSYSIGPAVQVGADYALNDRWSLNFDLKRVLLRTDLSTPSGATVTELKLDPWLIAIGLRRSF